MRLLPAFLLALAVVALVAAGARGELRFGLFIVFPLLVGEGPFAAAGIVLLVAAAVAWFVQRVRAAPTWEPYPAPPVRERGEAPEAPGEGRTRHGGVVLVGPFPIAWGSDRSMLRSVVLLAVLLALVMLVLLLLLRAQAL